MSPPPRGSRTGASASSRRLRLPEAARRTDWKRERSRSWLGSRTRCLLIRRYVCEVVADDSRWQASGSSGSAVPVRKRVDLADEAGEAAHERIRVLHEAHDQV